ncbi:hypothetical protein EIKCOROL_00398, partial [Eikenella corrodens ATCC 23834]
MLSQSRAANGKQQCCQHHLFHHFLPINRGYSAKLKTASSLTPTLNNRLPEKQASLPSGNIF